MDIRQIPVRKNKNAEDEARKKRKKKKNDVSVEYMYFLTYCRTRCLSHRMRANERADRE
jgi:hypothetical protein